MKKTASSLITKGKGYALTEGGKYITVSEFDGSGKYGYSNKYIPNTAENRKKLFAVMGKPDDTNIYRGKKRMLWF